MIQKKFAISVGINGTNETIKGAMYLKLFLGMGERMEDKSCINCKYYKPKNLFPDGTNGHCHNQKSIFYYKIPCVVADDNNCKYFKKMTKRSPNERY